MCNEIYRVAFVVVSNNYGKRSWPFAPHPLQGHVVFRCWCTRGSPFFSKRVVRRIIDFSDPRSLSPNVYIPTCNVCTRSGVDISPRSVHTAHVYSLARGLGKLSLSHRHGAACTLSAFSPDLNHYIVMYRDTLAPSGNPFTADQTFVSYLFYWIPMYNIVI